MNIDLSGKYLECISVDSKTPKYCGKNCPFWDKEAMAEIYCRAFGEKLVRNVENVGQNDPFIGLLRCYSCGKRVFPTI